MVQHPCKTAEEDLPLLLGPLLEMPGRQWNNSPHILVLSKIRIVLEDKPAGSSKVKNVLSRTTRPSSCFTPPAFRAKRIKNPSDAISLMHPRRVSPYAGNPHSLHPQACGSKKFVKKTEWRTSSSQHASNVNDTPRHGHFGMYLSFRKRDGSFMKATLKTNLTQYGHVATRCGDPPTSPVWV